MNSIRHRSPKTENTYSNRYFKSPKKKQENIINFNNPNIIQNNNFNYNYRDKNYNYYDEITKAFNFITFVLHQKDSQIKELKIKIQILQKQINDINDSNLMTFKKKENNKDQNSITENISDLNRYNFKHSTFNYEQNKNTITSINSDNKKYEQINYILPTQKQIIKNNINKNNNIIKMNIKNLDNNNTNIIHKIKNSTNINKINNYRNNIDLNNKQGNNNITNFSNNEMKNKNNNININLNINEHSKEKKNINKIRKVPYHTNQNQIIKFRNGSGNKYKNYTTETESSIVTEKMKILTFDHSMSNLGKPNSKSNSFTISDDGNFVKSKNEIKNFLKEIKRILEPGKFKKFINLIKNLIKNKNTEQKNQYIFEIKNLLEDSNLINKFERIMKLK